MDCCPLPLEVCLKSRGQRGCDSLEPFDKLLVKSTQSNELSNFLNRSWRRPTSNELDLFGVRVYSICVDDVSVISQVIWASEKLSGGSIPDLSKLQDPRELGYLLIFGLYSKPIAYC